MRKALSLAVLACALVVGIACSDSSTPTAPAASSPTAAVTAEVSLESASKLYICHGDKSDIPYGVVVEVSDETYKRHYRHLGSTRDCECQYDSIAGEQCTVTNGSGYDCANSYDCPSLY